MARLREFHKCLEQGAPELGLGTFHPSPFTQHLLCSLGLSWEGNLTNGLSLEGISPMITLESDCVLLIHGLKRFSRLALGTGQRWHFHFHQRGRRPPRSLGLGKPASSWQPQGRPHHGSGKEHWAAGLWDSPCSPQESHQVRASDGQVPALAKEPMRLWQWQEDVHIAAALKPYRPSYPFTRAEGKH